MVIGCGYISCQHLADIYYRDNVQVVSVVDCDPLLAEDVARKCGALAAARTTKRFWMTRGSTS